MGTLYNRYKHQPGPKPRQPIIVTNPNDPRLKAYNDSLTLYNAGETAYNNFKMFNYKSNGQERMTFDNWNNHVEPRADPKVHKSVQNLTKLNGNFPQPINTIPIPIYDKNKFVGDGVINRFKKPVQPVVYQKLQQIEQPEKIFPRPAKAQAKIQITAPKQSMMEAPVQQPTNWSFTYPGEQGVNQQQYFNSQVEYDAALKTASSGNPIGNSNFMGSKQEGNQYSSQFKSQPKYQNGGTMGTLYAAYRKNKLAGGGSLYGDMYSQASSIETEVPPIIGGGSRSYTGGVSGGGSGGGALTNLGSQGTLGVSASRAGNKVNWGAAAGGVAGIANEVIDSSGKGDPLTGRKSVGSYIAKGAISGAATGTSILPGWGTLIGAVVGAGAGWITGGSKKRKARKAMYNEINENRVDAINYSSSMAARDPTSYAGNRNADYYGMYGGSMRAHYKYGGSMTKFGKGGTTEMSAPLATMFMNGGQAKSLSSDNAILIGNSHKQGGIHIPEMNAEVEGGETTVGDYVFSKKLGFADLHKPIAKAKGKIEAKPMTPERVNALRRLKNEEQSMIMSQEYFKKQLGVS